MFYNWNVIGHEKELSMLEEDIRGSNIHHAYLFAGPSKIGKFRIARSMAGILQCQNNFCHKCPICIQIERRCHLDTIELKDNNESVKIDEIREIIERVNMTGQGAYKILLLQNTGRLTEEASNCLLKTLEEPPSKTVFIFTAGQIQDVMPTIASRMRIINFKKLPDEILKEALKKRYPDADNEMLDQVLLLSLGRSGTAIQLLSNPEAFQRLREIYRNIQFLDEEGSISTRISAMQELSKDPQKTKTFLALLVHFYRRKMLNTGSPENKKRAANVIKEIHRVMNLMERNVNPRLLLENIMLQI
ncbi:hypothetical protein HZC21_02790 [Candidatus Peregrinibacteria bacterium]|nr:hypothetical protein [Candidatus Peregrinibacteria bacterium]